MYTVIKRILEGIDIIGYVVADEDGIEKSLKEEDMIRLCHKNMVINAALIELDGVETLIITDDISKMPSTSKAKRGMGLKVVCRLIGKTSENKDTCVGYIVQDRAGKKIRLDNSKAWRLAKHNNIEDIKADIVSGKKVIRSLREGLLEELPTMEV